MLELYKKTFVGMQIVICSVTGAVLVWRHLWGLAALFFVTMGLLVDPRALISNLLLLAVMIGLILVGKFVIWTVVVWLFGYSIWTAVLVGVGLTQIGEFSFILVQVARNSGLVGSDVYNATLAASLVTILASVVPFCWIASQIKIQRASWHTRRVPIAGGYSVPGLGRRSRLALRYPDSGRTLHRL